MIAYSSQAQHGKWVAGIEGVGSLAFVEESLTCIGSASGRGDKELAKAVGVSPHAARNWLARRLQTMP
jgi:hypothetical protein